MKKLICRLYENAVIRYLFFGGCTTLVNMASFYFLRKMQISLNMANFISIVLAILFAYVVNSKYVFENKNESFGEYVKTFIRFVGARITTMIIEIAGLWLAVDLLSMNEMLGKFMIQFVVIVLNYIFSKLFVFVKR